MRFLAPLRPGPQGVGGAGGWPAATAGRSGPWRLQAEQRQALRRRTPADASTTVGTDTTTAHPRRRDWKEAHDASAPFSIDPYAGVQPLPRTEWHMERG